MPRKLIVNTYAEWTAFSATRSGSPIKARKDVYPLIRKPDYNKLFEGSTISEEEFSNWHQINTEKIANNSVLPIGWAAKIINVYLKTRVYIGREGRDNLCAHIHPPIDNGLWDGIGKYCKTNNLKKIEQKIFIVDRIKNIDTYDKYSEIIDGCRDLAGHMNCKLLEVEQLWEGTNFNEDGK
jgi:hypothetical protein